MLGRSLWDGRGNRAHKILKVGGYSGKGSGDLPKYENVIKEPVRV